MFEMLAGELLLHYVVIVRFEIISALRCTARTWSGRRASLSCSIRGVLCCLAALRSIVIEAEHG
jgi:hypothetical protein